MYLTNALYTPDSESHWDREKEAVGEFEFTSVIS